MIKEFKTLLPYLKQRLPHYLAGLLFLIITDAGQLYLPQLIRRAVDTIAGGDFTLAVILLIAGQMILIAAVVAVGRFFWRIFIQGSARRIETKLRETLFAHLQKLSSSFYGKSKTGDLMARFTNDIQAIRMASSMAFVAFVDGVFMTIAILVILFSQNPRLALLCISPFPIITVGALFFGKIVGERFRRVQEGFAKLSEMTQESISGIRVLKTFVQEKAFVRRFGEANSDYTQRNMALVRTWGVFFPAVGFLAGMTQLLFLLFGGRSVMEGTLSPGEFTAFFAYLNMLIWPMMGAGFIINLIQRAGASLGRLNRILEEEPNIVSSPDAVREPIRGSIKIQNLSYTYPGAKEPALRDINLEIPAGSTLGILGKTASGKSTLVQLLPRILDPPPGTVLIDDRDVHQFDLSTLRSNIGMVPQDGFLFSTSIKDNIAFGGREEDDARLQEVTRISTIARDLQNFPDGWETVVGERGITLSGGQKQRVSISRALAGDSALYVFDDALSSVDTETEDAILQGMLPYTRGKTLILISHRISTLKLADTIVVLEEGRIVQRGSHEQLVKQPGFYGEIFRIQQLEEGMRKEI